MRVVIDSHVLLWWAFQPEGSRLSRRATKVLEDPSTECLLSMATVWELALKADRLGFQTRFEPLIESAIRALALTILGIELRHIAHSVSLPWHHRDPFDRILVSQAILEDVPIVTMDRRIAEYPVRVLW